LEKLNEVWDKIFPLQVGDRVKVTSGQWSHIYIGLTGIIRTIWKFKDGDLYRVEFETQFDGDDGWRWFYEHELKKAN